MDANLEIIIAVAVSKNGVIGKEGKMPWHLPDDLKNFARLTKGHIVLMGRKTYDSIGHPLPGRDNIILTRDSGFDVAGCIVAKSLSDAITFAKSRGKEKLFVSGGAEIYKAMFPLADTMFLTEVDVEIEDGDAFFPEWDKTQWKEIDSFAVNADDNNQYGFIIKELHRLRT